MRGQSTGYKSKAGAITEVAKSSLIADDVFFFLLAMCLYFVKHIPQSAQGVIVTSFFYRSSGTLATITQRSAHHLLLYDAGYFLVERFGNMLCLAICFGHTGKTDAAHTSEKTTDCSASDPFSRQIHLILILAVGYLDVAAFSLGGYYNLFQKIIRLAP